jgi:hypothetical protein
LSFASFFSVAWNVDALKAGSTFPTVYLASFNHLAIVCWSHNLTACAVAFFSHKARANIAPRIAPSMQAPNKSFIFYSFSFSLVIE